MKAPSERKKTPVSKYLKDYHVDLTGNAGIQQCPKCPQVFTRKTILYMHIRMSHKSKETTSSAPSTPQKEISENVEEPVISKEIEVKKEEELEKVEVIDSAIKDIDFSEEVQIKEEKIETKEAVETKEEEKVEVETKEEVKIEEAVEVIIIF